MSARFAKLEDDCGNKSLTPAVEKKNELNIRMLLKAGANMSLESKGFFVRYSPLHVAVERGYVKLVTILLEAGSDISVPCGHGFTPLHYAAECNKSECCRILQVSTIHSRIASLNNYFILLGKGIGGLGGPRRTDTCSDCDFKGIHEMH